jgi:L-threonylcarbamoyladenylate synthase
MIVSPTPDALAYAVQQLAADQLVAFPTETVYGLGADAASAQGVARIYMLKGRPRSHPLIVHVLDEEHAQDWADLDERARALAQAFWPGPLTLVVPRRPQAPDWACGGQASIALRCPLHPVAQALLRAWAYRGGRGLAAPSANRFGRVSPTKAQHVLDDLGADAPLILEGGAAMIGVESSIVDLTRVRPVVLRPGRISLAELERVLGAPVGVADADAPRAPGTLPAHYQPKTLVELCFEAALAERAAMLMPQRSVVWSAQRPAGDGILYWEPQPDDPHVCEQRLYDTLRRLDTMGADRILIATPPAGSAWSALRDRLMRAAAFGLA